MSHRALLESKNIRLRAILTSVKLARGYKVEDGWRETDNLGSDDLLPAAKLLDLAHTWIMHQQQADAKARKESEQAAA